MGPSVATECNIRSNGTVIQALAQLTMFDREHSGINDPSKQHLQDCPASVTFTFLHKDL